jgi:hypothetical protein
LLCTSLNNPTVTVRKFANFLNADYPRAIFIEKVSQYAKAFWLKQRLFGVFVTNCCVCCKFATKHLLDGAEMAPRMH